MSRYLLVLLVLLGTGSDRVGTSRGAPVPARKTVAVLSFDNHTGKTDYDPLGKGIASMMTTDLSSVDAIQLLERERLQDVIKEMDAQQTAYFDSSTAVRVGRMVGAQYIVTGAIAAVQPQIRLDTRVVRVETGEIVKTAQVTGKEDQFFDLEKRLAHKLLDGLEVALTPEDERKLQTRQESNHINDLSTVLGFSQAIALSDRGDYVGAATRMAPVMKAAPNSLVVKLTYDEIKRRAAAKSKSKANDKAKEGLGKLLRKWPP
jgi:TolB-like protein